MSEHEKSEKTQAELQRDIFAGLNGRQPTSDQEFSEWFATDEGRRRLWSPSFRFGVTGPERGDYPKSASPLTWINVLPGAAT